MPLATEPAAAEGAGAPAAAAPAVPTPQGTLQKKLSWVRRLVPGRNAENCGQLLLGLVRVFHFLRLVGPIVLHYKVKQLLSRVFGWTVPDEEWEEMHKYYAPRALEIAQMMQGFYIKIGQHLATTMYSYVPLPYVDCFKSLLEHCPAQSFSVVKSIVERELGPLDKTFESFNEFPLNAASTGQVHIAKLLNGHEVVVKVQHPNAEWTFGVDLNLFVCTAEALLPPAAGICKQIKKNLANEFDYEREAALQREALHHLEGFSNIVVPEPVDSRHPVSPTAAGLCTKRVLVMDRLFGMSLADWGRAQIEAQARKQGKTVRELQAEYMVCSAAEMEGLRPSALGLGAYFMVNKGADIACNVALFFYNWGLGYMLRRAVKYVETPLPPNIHVITQDLMEAQGHMIFRAGFVNCDPHAGNVMLLRDGRLALIDWGQVVRLSTEQRCIMAGLYIAVADKDDVMSADCMRALGGRTKHNWDWTQAMWAKLCTWSIQECEKNDFTRLSEVMDQADMTIKEADSAYLMTFKNQLYTRQVAAMLGFFGINSAVALRELAQQCLQEAGWPVPQTKPTEIPMPKLIREMLETDSAPKRMLNALQKDVAACVPGWRRLLPVALPPLASYSVLCILRCVQVSRTARGAVLAALCALIAAGMGVYTSQRVTHKETANKLDSVNSTPCFCFDDREVALATM